MLDKLSKPEIDGLEQVSWWVNLLANFHYKWAKAKGLFHAGKINDQVNFIDRIEEEITKLKLHGINCNRPDPDKYEKAVADIILRSLSHAKNQELDIGTILVDKVKENFEKYSERDSN